MLQADYNPRVTKTGIAVLASARGTNFEALARAAQHEIFAGEVRLLLVNVPDAPVLRRAEALKIPSVVVNHKDFKKRAEFEAAVVKELAGRDIGLVCLAGFNRILSPFFTQRYAHKVINVHPSLLPAFAGLQGMQVHEAVIAAGVKVTGCTVHFVTDDLDAGPIIVQRAIPVRETDTAESLAIRVLVEEHQAYPEAVRLFCAGRLEVGDRVVRVLS